MSADTDGPREGERMEKINVRLPAAMLEEINEEYESRGYASRSEAIRDALRDWIEPSAKLSAETLEDLAESRRQAADGETSTGDEVRRRLGLDDG